MLEIIFIIKLVYFLPGLALSSIVGDLNLLVIIVTFLILFLYIFLIRKIKESRKNKGFNLRVDLRFISLVFLSIPIVNILYPLVLGFSNDKLKNHLVFLFLGVIYSYIALIYGLEELEGNNFHIMSLFPIFSLLLFSFSFRNKYLNILFKIIGIILMLLLIIPGINLELFHLLNI